MTTIARDRLQGRCVACHWFTAWPSLAFAVALASALSWQVFAVSFNAGISPPRFELKAQPGEKLREIVSIFNAENDVASFQVRTADWDLDGNGGVIIEPEALQPGSCRPWTRIERRRFQVRPRGTKKYRFEVQIPPDASPGQCRFAIVIAPAPPKAPAASVRGDSPLSVQFPITAQIAVIVYVTIGDAAPALELAGARMKDVRGKAVPVVAIRNTGTAHGRPFGTITAVDASGTEFALVVVPYPILPGRTEDIVLQLDPTLGKQSFPSLQTPVALEGSIEFDGGAQDIKLQIQ